MIRKGIKKWPEPNRAKVSGVSAGVSGIACLDINK